MDPRLLGRRALITGAGGGIGRATAERLAAEGAELWLTDLDTDRLRETAAGCGDAAADVVTIPGDLTDDDFVHQLADTVTGHGERPLHILANVAGAIGSTPFGEWTGQEWDRLHRINARAPFMLTQAVLPALRRSGSASVVNVSSIAGIRGLDNAAAYGSSKAALVGMTLGAAIDLAPAIRVNVICPGSVDTAMPRAFLDGFDEAAREERRNGLIARHLIPRLGRPEEVAAVVAFLACDDSAFMTGSILTPDGGWSAW